MADPIAFNPEVEAAAARARASGFRVAAASTRKRHRIVTDPSTGEQKVITEEAPDPVPGAVAAYRSHSLFAPSMAAEVPERHGLDDEQRARFWQEVGGRGG